MTAFLRKRRLYFSLAAVGGLLILIAAFAFGKAQLRDELYERAATLTNGGDARKGKEAIDRYGCAACHIVPGKNWPDASVGPSLVDIGERSAIAGVIMNTPKNMINWIVNPQAIDPQTAMPRLGVTPDEAKDIAAYLYASK